MLATSTHARTPRHPRIPVTLETPVTVKPPVPLHFDYIHLLCFQMLATSTHPRNTSHPKILRYPIDPSHSRAPSHPTF